MNIQYCSDLHLEFPANREHLKNNPLIPEGEMLILAGDIVNFSALHAHNGFFDFLSKNFKIVYWIPGNHEYYGYDIRKRSGSFSEQIRDNVILLNNQVIERDNIRLVFSTLWSRISAVNHWAIQQSVSDFHTIKYNGRRFNPDDFNLLHERNLNFIRASLKSDNSRTIVVTHHVPTFINYPKPYLGSPLNEAFAVDLYDLVQESGAPYWIYGHHHHNSPAFTIGQTQLITNQLGYVERNEHLSFNPASQFIF